MANSVDPDETGYYFYQLLYIELATTCIFIKILISSAFFAIVFS